MALSGDDATMVLDHQTAVLERLTEGARLGSVLDDIVTALESLIDGSRCSILLLDDAGVLRHGAAPHLPSAYLQGIDGLVPGPAAGSCGTAVHLGAQVVASDVFTDVRWERFRDLARRHGIGACWSRPIWSHNQIVGTFAVYWDQAHEPVDRERELVGRFSHLAAMAIAHDGAVAEREARHAAEVARQSAERSNHAKSQFVTSLSHELRTPLQSISGFTENLRLLDLPPERRRQALDGIAKASAHILSLVDDVLDLATVEAGAMAIVPAVVDTAEVVASAVAIAQPLAGERSIDLRCEGAAVRIRADRRRLQQVLLNLLSNAIRFSRPGSAITVRTVLRPDHPGTVHVEVADEGPGIPEDLQARLFVPFDRLGADAGREGGAGLGLVLARRLTEAMDGTFELHSTVGVGTEVRLGLPVDTSGA